MEMELHYQNKKDKNSSKKSKPFIKKRPFSNPNYRNTKTKKNKLGFKFKQSASNYGEWGINKSS